MSIESDQPIFGVSEGAYAVAFRRAELAEQQAEKFRVVLQGIADVNMQTRNDAEKLKELAEWRLEAKRVLALTTTEGT